MRSSPLLAALLAGLCGALLAQGTGCSNPNVYIGAGCYADSDCASLGKSAYCKVTSVPPDGGAATDYIIGICTQPCDDTTSCPSHTVCAGGPNSYLSLFNETSRFCISTCAAGAIACASPLVCAQVGDLAAPTPVTGCWWPRAFQHFTGGGTPDKLGASCTTSADCASPPSSLVAVCIPETSGFVGGYCAADSHLADDDTWCGDAGTDVPYALSDGGAGFSCYQRCDSPGQGRVVGRDGYVCRTVISSADGGLRGYVAPACDAPYNHCSASTNCEVDSGYCCLPADGGCFY
jgi:hypothetical protein